MKATDAAKKRVGWLLGELDEWLREGLVDADQAERLRARYATAKAGPPWARLIFSSLGALLLGLGVILLFAYNWQQMHRLLKLAVILGALLASHASARWFERVEPRRPALVEGLHFLGTILFGAGIWLVSQIYHIDTHDATAFLLWGLGALALAAALPSVTHGLLACALLLVWQREAVLDYGSTNALATPLLLVGGAGLAWALRSRALLFTSALAVGVSLTLSVSRFPHGLGLAVLLGYAGALLAARELLLSSQARRALAPAVSLPGHALYFAFLYMLSFREIRHSSMVLDLHSATVAIYFGCAALTCTAAWAAVVVRREQGGGRWTSLEGLQRAWVMLLLAWVIGGTLALSLFLAPRLAVFLDWTTLVLCNLALFAHGTAQVVEGSRRGQLPKTSVGCLLVILIIVTRYVDLFESLLARSLVFFIVGGVVFGVGNFYTRSTRSRLREGASS